MDWEKIIGLPADRNRAINGKLVDRLQFTRDLPEKLSTLRRGHKRSIRWRVDSTPLYLAGREIVLGSGNLAAHVRHRYTNYDDLLASLADGDIDGYNELRTKVLDMVSAKLVEAYGNQLDRHELISHMDSQSQQDEGEPHGIASYIQNDDSYSGKVAK